MICTMGANNVAGEYSPTTPRDGDGRIVLTPMVDYGYRATNECDDAPISTGIMLRGVFFPFLSCLSQLPTALLGEASMNASSEFL